MSQNVQTQTLIRTSTFGRDIALIVGASWLVAMCAHISLPVPFSPVPFTMQNFAVLLVGLALGPRRGFAALAAYLAQGAAGLPFFAPGIGGIAQLLGPTGGYLMAYPLVAAVAGFIFYAFRKHGLLQALLASFSAECLLFICGVSWLSLYTHSSATAAILGLKVFIPFEIAKIILAALVATKIEVKTIEA